MFLFKSFFKGVFKMLIFFRGARNFKTKKICFPKLYLKKRFLKKSVLIKKKFYRVKKKNCFKNYFSALYKKLFSALNQNCFL